MRFSMYRLPTCLYMITPTADLVTFCADCQSNCPYLLCIAKSYVDDASLAMVDLSFLSVIVHLSSLQTSLSDLVWETLLNSTVCDDVDDISDPVIAIRGGPSRMCYGCTNL